MIDDFSTDLDYVLDNNGDLAYMYHVPLCEVIGEIKDWEGMSMHNLDNFPVRSLKDDEPAKDRMTCGTCNRSWDDSIVTGYTPTPSGRCPFEFFHDTE